MAEKDQEQTQDQDRKSRFKELLSSVEELATEIGFGEYEILEEHRGISPAVDRALDRGITDVTLKHLVSRNAGLRIRTNDRGYGAKADFIIRLEKGEHEKYLAGAGGGMPGKTSHGFIWLGEPRQFGAEEIWNDVELLDVLADTVEALTAAYDVKRATRKMAQTNVQETQPAG